MKLITVLLIVMAALTPLGLYFMKNEVRQMEQDISFLNKTLTQDQESIRVLQAEWSYLNQPARLDELSNKYLGLGPVATSQVVRAKDLPYRKLELVRYPDVSTPNAGIVSVSAR